MTSNWLSIGRNNKRDRVRGISMKLLAPEAFELENRLLLSLNPTLTTLTGSSSSIAAGQQITLKATVYAQGVQAVPAGTVTFYDGSTPLSTATLARRSNSSASATFTTPALDLGVHTFYVSYAGDGSQFEGSGSPDQIGGVINTVAGSGPNPASGVPATLTSLNFPEGAAVDKDGNIFIADASNNVIREVVKSTGNIITVAGNGIGGYSGDGGPATSAKLYNRRSAHLGGIISEFRLG